MRTEDIEDGPGNNLKPVKALVSEMKLCRWKYQRRVRNAKQLIPRRINSGSFAGR